MGFNRYWTQEDTGRHRKTQEDSGRHRVTWLHRGQSVENSNTVSPVV